jgi:hypothetical protein
MRRGYALFAIVLVVSAGLIVSGEGRGHAQQPPAQQPLQQWPLARGRGVCFTQTGWCPLNGTAPIGAVCYCTIPPNTHVYGTATTHEYRGHVSPYFNLHSTVPTTIR